MLIELLTLALVMFLIIVLVRYIAPDLEWAARVVCVVLLLIWLIRFIGLYTHLS